MFRVQLAQIETMLISGEHDKLIEALMPVREARLDWVEKYEQGRNGNADDKTGQPLERPDKRSGG